jgi:tetratricopeptide (TPR) repeat protein
MVASILKVPVAQVRSWLRRGWLVPAAVEHKLPLLDFAELNVARQLAQLVQAGLKPAQIERKLAEIAAATGAARPLAELSIVADGRQLLVRRAGGLAEPGGQLRLEFETAADEPAALPGPALAAPQRGGPLTTSQMAAFAAELEEAGDLNAAAEMYRAAMMAGGPTAELCFSLGEVLYRLGQVQAARERYSMAVELDEDFLEARCNLGCVLAELGERELAAAALEGALACHPGYADAHWHLASLSLEEGDFDKAFVHWREFLKLAPESPWADEARRNLAWREAAEPPG